MCTTAQAQGSSFNVLMGCMADGESVVSVGNIKSARGGAKIVPLHWYQGSASGTISPCYLANQP